jgi:TolB protein
LKWSLLAGTVYLILICHLSPALAQDDRPRIDGVIEGGMAAIKIAVPPPMADSADDPNASDLILTLRDDLRFSGFFDIVDPSLYRLVPPAEGAEERHEDWLSIGAEALVRLRLRSSGDRIDLEARLYDNSGGGLLFARRYGGSTDLVRRVAHTLADDLVKHYTGQPGIAATRISFVSAHGDNKEIYLMDYDGRRIRRLTTSSTLNITPAWSPDGNELAYVSWRGRQPAVYVMSSEGKLGVLDIVGSELSSSPDWAPDGRRLVYSADVDGNTELFVLDRSNGSNTRLTHHAAIDTSPAYSPNGREIAFTSDRTGVPQIYIMSAEGVNVRRVSWGGSYNDSAAWSPNGDRLAYASRVDGWFEIVVLDLTTEKVNQLTRGPGHNENPRWSPDGRHIVFSSNRDGDYQIYTMRADGSDVRQLTRGRESYTPDWSR